MHSGTVFLVVGHQVCIHLRRGFSRLLALQILSPVDVLKAAGLDNIALSSTAVGESSSTLQRVTVLKDPFF